MLKHFYFGSAVLRYLTALGDKARIDPKSVLQGNPKRKSPAVKCSSGYRKEQETGCRQCEPQASWGKLLSPFP
jgi:hypothetical protein